MHSDMHPSIRRQLIAAHSEYRERVSFPSQYNVMRDGAFGWWYDKSAEIVHNAGDLMSNQEKLNNLRSPKFFEDRKKIIRLMVKDDKIDPNSITYRGTNPLRECANLKDYSFAEFLLKHGARPDAITLEKTKNNPPLNSLFLKYNQQNNDLS